jgi:tetratricopeptide (TPR) repeat protein
VIASLLALLLMQVGPNPATGAMPGVPDELRNRPPRPDSEGTTPEVPASPHGDYLKRCLILAANEPEDALNYANAWRKDVQNELELAQSAQCLGLALVKLERFDEARRIFEVASKEAPEELRAYRARLAGMAGNAALADGKPDLAQPLFQQALGEASMDGDATLIAGFQIDRARALVAAGKPEDAVSALEAARAADPGNARAWLLSATLSRRLDKLDEAQQEIEQAATLNPRDPAIGLEAGVIAALAGRDEDARKSFESVMTVAPDSDEATHAKAYLEQLRP